jgi:DNA repair photolyase
LVLRDLDILKGAKNFEVGLTITTADDEIRKLFEPNAPPIKERISTLDELHRSGIRTYAMIAPILPGAETLADALEGKVDYIIIDRMNYHYADWIYRKYRLEDKLSDDYFQMTGCELANGCKKFPL